MLVVAAHLGWSQGATLNSVEEAMKLALTANVDYKNYILNQEKASVEYKQSRAYLMPTVTGSFGGQRNLDIPVNQLTITDENSGMVQQQTIQLGQDYQYNAGINIYKELLSREAALQSRVSKLNMKSEEVSKEIYEELLAEQVSLYYFTAIVARRAIELGNQDLESAERIHALTKEKFDEGLVDAISFNTSKINANTVRQNLNASKQLELQSISELKRLFGMIPSDELELTNKFDYYLPELYTADELGENLKVETASLQLDQANMLLKISQASLLPTLSISSYFGQQQFRDDFGLSFSGNDWSANNYLSLNLTIPIFSGFSNRLNIKRSKYEQQIAVNEKEKAQQSALLDDARLISEYNLSLDDAKSSLETYRLYDENQQLTYEKYEEGLISLDAYLKVFEDYLRAENTYLNNMSKLYTYYSQIIPRIQP